jgi:hypothetical protein
MAGAAMANKIPTRPRRIIRSIPLFDDVFNERARD